MGSHGWNGDSGGHPKQGDTILTKQRVEYSLNVPVIQMESKKDKPQKSGYSRHVLTKLTISLERIC